MPERRQARAIVASSGPRSAAPCSRDDVRGHEVERALAQDPGRLAALVALDPSAGRDRASCGRGRPRRRAAADAQAEWPSWLTGRPPLADRRLQQRPCRPPAGPRSSHGRRSSHRRGALRPRPARRAATSPAVARVVEAAPPPRARQADEVDVEVVDARDRPPPRPRRRPALRLGSAAHFVPVADGDHPAVGDPDRFGRLEPAGRGQRRRSCRG